MKHGNYAKRVFDANDVDRIGERNGRDDQEANRHASVSPVAYDRRAQKPCAEIERANLFRHEKARLFKGGRDQMDRIPAR